MLTMFSRIFLLAVTLALKVMLHEPIRNDDFLRNPVLQHCCDIVSNSYNIVPTLQHCVALKIVVANRPVYIRSEFWFRRIPLV